MKICIDPGHSGPVEPGACAGGFTEAQLNLDISLLTGRLLSEAGHEVIYTRETDIDEDGLAFQADIANEAEANIFISIHCNAADRLEAHGVETYCYNGSTDGRELAQCLQIKLAEANYTIDRGVKEANFAVLRLTNMPAVLIESGFITSEHDRQIITTPDGQQTIAASIVSGIETYLL